MRSILNATGLPEGWGVESEDVPEDTRPGYAVHAVTNPARVRPDWQAKSNPRPIFPATSGPHFDPFAAIEGTRSFASTWTWTERQRDAWAHKRGGDA